MTDENKKDESYGCHSFEREAFVYSTSKTFLIERKSQRRSSAGTNTHTQQFIKLNQQLNAITKFSAHILHNIAKSNEPGSACMLFGADEI